MGRTGIPACLVLLVFNTDSNLSLRIPVPSSLNSQFYPQTRGLSYLVTNARVEIAIGNVDQQIHHQESYGNEGNDADNERLVAVR